MSKDVRVQVSPKLLWKVGRCWVAALVLKTRPEKSGDLGSIPSLSAMNINKKFIEEANELTDTEILTIREAIEAAWSEGQCSVSYKTLLKLGFKEDHYVVEHMKMFDCDKG